MYFNYQQFLPESVPALLKRSRAGNNIFDWSTQPAKVTAGSCEPARVSERSVQPVKAKEGRARTDNSATQSAKAAGTKAAGTKATATNAAGTTKSPAPILYSQCWEDADVLLSALAIEPEDICLSIASAGDNTLALLACCPEKVVAIDRNPAQLACLELRMAAFKELGYENMLQFLGLRPVDRGNAGSFRIKTYAQIRHNLSASASNFWDSQTRLIQNGIVSAGKFEHYFSIFRRLVLPLVHSRHTVDSLLEKRPSRQDRLEFYEQEWNTRAWRLMFQVFFSRAVMGVLGRQRSCFDHVRGPVATRILQRVEHALIELEPAVNPYLHWILKGHYSEDLPFALRSENFDIIKSQLLEGKLELRPFSLDEALLQSRQSGEKFTKYNLSDVFEYMSSAEHENMMNLIAGQSKDGARLAFWNMLCDQSLSACPQVETKTNLSQILHGTDKAFFYSSFVIQEIHK